MPGSPSYDFLHESFLFDEETAAASYPGVSDDELRQELVRYREHIDSATDDLGPRVGASGGHLRLLGGEGTVDLRLLQQCAWYVPEFIIRDPLYELTALPSNAQEPMARLLGLAGPDALDLRNAVGKAVLHLRAMTPMVAAGYVRLLPISRLFEPPAQLPITVYDNAGADLLPTHLMRWFADFEQPAIESLIAYLITEQTPPWTLDQLETIRNSYFDQRYRKGRLQLPDIFEAAVTLHLAEEQRLAGNYARARELIAAAVEDLPLHDALHTVEAAVATGDLPPIQWPRLCSPHRDSSSRVARVSLTHLNPRGGRNCPLSQPAPRSPSRRLRRRRASRVGGG